MLKRIIPLCLLLLSQAAPILAADQPASSAAAPDAAAPPAVQESIRNSLAVLLPGLVPDSIRTTPVDNLYEVAFGMRLVYLTGDGRFLVQGKLTDLETRTEITNERLSALKMAELNKLDEQQMIIYGPADAKHTVTVFTDIDCGYCRKLHSHMAEYNDLGIRVRYLFFPRAGLGSPSYAKAVSVWCADDQHAAMDQAKGGGAVAPKTCDNPVADQYAFGQSMRIQGTPALLLDDGEMVPGYREPKDLIKLLDQHAAAAKG